MQKILGWIVTVIGALLVVFALLFAYSRLRGPTAEQRSSLALLEKRAAPPGRNVFAAMWLLPFDVPESQLAALAAEDVRRVANRPHPLTDAPSAQPFESIAAERYRQNAMPDPDAPGLCKSSGESCLATVRRAIDASRKLVDLNSAYIARAEKLTQYDFYRSGFAVRWDMPFPLRQDRPLLHTSYALKFIEGEHDAALAGMCRDLALWRRLVPGADTLIVSMTAIARADRSARLLAEMLAELPTDHRLPSECIAATAPPRDEEFLICEAMQGEFRYAKQSALSASKTSAGGLSPLAISDAFYDPDMYLAAIAPTYAWACSNAAREAVARDLPARILPVAGARLDSIGNLSGQMLASISTAMIEDYQRRAQDHGAAMRLLAVVAFLHANSDHGRPLHARLADLPADLRSPTRDVEIVEGGKALRMRMFHSRRGKHWQLPLSAATAV